MALGIHEGRLSPVRVGYLLRNRLLEEATIIGIGAAAIVGLNLLGLFLSKRVVFNSGGGTAWTFSLCLGGILLASGAFKAMHDGKAGTEWILLPATPLEKYLAALVDYAVVFPLAFSAAAMGISALLSLAERATGGPGFPAWTPMAAGGLAAWGKYAAAVALFLAGSASFRKAAFLKTVAVLSAYFLAMGLILGGGAWLLYRDSGFGSFRMNQGIISIQGGTLPEGAARALQIVFDVARYALAPIFALLYGWARVAEKEARDEVQ